MSGAAAVQTPGPGDDANVNVSEPKKERSPIARYDQIYDIHNSHFTLVKSIKSDLNKKARRKAVLVVRRLIDDKGFHTGTEVDIRSQHVAQAMREIHADVEDVSLRANPPMVPLEIFFHSQHGLQTKLEQAMASEPQDQSLVSDLEMAVKFCDDEFRPVIANLDALLAAGEITWDLLWTIFAPNVLLYRHHAFVDQDQVLKLRTFKKSQNQHRDATQWFLNCHIVTDDGIKFGLAYEPSIGVIEEFDGARKITDLPTFPIKHHPDADRITASALIQGRRFSQFKANQIMETSGPAMFDKVGIDGRMVTTKFSSHGRAIIDPAGFRSYNPVHRVPGIDIIPSEVHRVRLPDELTEEECIICTPVVLGFCFGTKKWGGFAVSRLLDVQWNPQAFQDLVLEDRAKALIHSLVKQHSPDDGFDDVVAGKGKGIVSLFSGPPGTGKTLTAEAVAESTRRPLYICSAGDLGSEAMQIDPNLTMILELSARWKSVLLIDEADVFLQQRTELDINRNALISIFLRQLEYHPGLLILTTNRIGSCDEAFESRIHFSVRYPELDAAARRKIWTTFVKRAHNLQGQTAEINVTEDDISRLAKIRVNGRQIKNIVNSARIVAKDQDETLSMKHITLIMEVTSAGLGQDWNVAEHLQQV